MLTVTNWVKMRGTLKWVLGIRDKSSFVWYLVAILNWVVSKAYI